MRFGPAGALAATAFLIPLLLLTPAEGEAQVHRFGAGWSAGGSYLSNLNPGAAGGAEDVAPGVGFHFGLHIDRWYGHEGRFGLRYQGAYQQPRVDWAQGERKIDAFSADLSFLYRVAEPGDPEAILPYLAAGLGGIWYDLGTRQSTLFPEADAFHDGRSRVLPTVILGAGADVPFPWDWESSPVRVRLEVADHISFGSPIRQLSDGSRYGAVHHLRFSVGAYSVLDILSR